jgi:hypothetical protein
MRTIFDRGRRWLASILVALGGSMLLSACSPPASPTATDSAEAAARGGGEAGAARSSSVRGIVFCPWCRATVIEESRGPAKVYVGLTNTGDEALDGVAVWSYLLRADGLVIPVSETHHLAPRPGQTIDITVEVEVPSRTPAGSYSILLKLSPESRDRDEIWVSNETITVAGW